MTVADLKIEGVENYQQITNFEIFEAANTHGICKITFVMKADFKVSEIINWAQKKVTVKGKVKDSDKIIFCGIATDYGVKNNAGAIFLSVTVKTLSCQLETSKKSSCTFQKASKKFSDILNKVKETYAGSDLTAADDKEIPELIYRKNLTDWEFLRELAESHGQILFCDSKTDKLKINLGFKEFKTFTEDDIKVGDKLKFMRQSVPLDFYKRLEKNTYERARPTYFVDLDFFTYNVEVGVGHGVNYDNQVQAVIASHVFLRENILCNEIKIRHKEGCRADAWDVTKFFDRFYYLTGSVLEVSGDKKTDLKIQFDCDEKQEKADALNIPYESVLSNYLYTMPDEKDKVFVYFEKNLLSALGSLRTKEVTEKPENKSFKTKNSALDFNKDKISFTAEKDKAELTEEDSIKINAKKDVVFSASGDIFIQSAAGGLPDQQLIMAPAHLTQYTIYTAAMGQPATVQINPSGSTVGKVQAQITNVGSKKEEVQLSDLAKELDKITKRQNKQAEQKNSGGGSGGSLKIDGKKETVFNVKNSFIGLKGGKTNIKTRVFNNLGYIPVAGGGTGSGGVGGGSPDARAEQIKAEQGEQDRSRQAENIKPTADNKNISI